MDRDRLKGYLDEGLSLERIGALEGKHPSTIGYWVKKLGLEANGKSKHAPRGGLQRDHLANLVSRGVTLQGIAGELGVSVSTVRYWIKRHGLQKPIEARRAEIDRALADGSRTLLRRCGQHGWTTFVVENSGRARCRKCRILAVSNWRRRAKARLVAEAGGCCAICGYDTCVAGLHFHHINPAEKEFHLSNTGIPRSINLLRAEAAKCVLLCANCHAEVEAGVTEL